MRWLPGTLSFLPSIPGRVLPGPLRIQVLRGPQGTQPHDPVVQGTLETWSSLALGLYFPHL